MWASVFRIAHFRTRKPARHAIPAVSLPVTTGDPTPSMKTRPGLDDTQERDAAPAARPPSDTAGMPTDLAEHVRSLQKPDYTHLDGLTGFETSDGLTALIPVVEKTNLMPRVVETMPPSQQDGPWRPPVSSDDWTPAVRHVRRTALNELPAAGPQYDGESSYGALKGYDGYGGSRAHRAAVALDAPLFRPRVCDEAPGDRTLRAWMSRSDVLPAMARTPRRRGALDTQVMPLVGRGQFTNDTSEGRAV